MKVFLATLLCHFWPVASAASLFHSPFHRERDARTKHGRRPTSIAPPTTETQILSGGHPRGCPAYLSAQWFSLHLRADLGLGQSWDLGGPRLPRRFCHRLHGRSGWSAGAGGDNKYNVYCASDNGRRNNCPIDTARRRAPGSSAQRFALRLRVHLGLGQAWHLGRPWLPRRFRNWSGWLATSRKPVIYCSSDNMRRKVCPINTQGGVRIIRQRSDADCIYGRTWGYDARGIWVDRGCRADFEVGIRR